MQEPCIGDLQHKKSGLKVLVRKFAKASKTSFNKTQYSQVQSTVKLLLKVLRHMDRNRSA